MPIGWKRMCRGCGGGGGGAGALQPGSQVVQLAERELRLDTFALPELKPRSRRPKRPSTSIQQST
eukprot:6069164-Pyramimonas_sp.AAC.1